MPGRISRHSPCQVCDSGFLRLLFLFFVYDGTRPSFQAAMAMAMVMTPSGVEPDAGGKALQLTVTAAVVAIAVVLLLFR